MPETNGEYKPRLDKFDERLDRLVEIQELQARNLASLAETQQSQARNLTLAIDAIHALSDQADGSRASS